MAIQPTQPQGIGGVLDTTFQLYKASVGVVWPICLLQSLASSPPNIYLLAAGYGGASPAALAASLATPTYWLIILFTVLAATWVLGALYLKQYSIGVGEEQSTGTVLQLAAKRVLPMVGVLLLFGVAVAVGAVLLIVPGVILLVSLILATVLTLVEGKGPLDSLIASHKLVWGNWWRTAVILTVGFILAVVIYFAVGLVFTTLAPLLALGGGNVLLYGMLVGLLIGVFMNVLVAPFGAALMIALYWDLKLRKEGGDLAARVSALNAT